MGLPAARPDRGWKAALGAPRAAGGRQGGGSLFLAVPPPHGPDHSQPLPQLSSSLRSLAQGGQDAAELQDAGPSTGAQLYGS